MCVTCDARWQWQLHASNFENASKWMRTENIDWRPQEQTTRAMPIPLMLSCGFGGDIEHCNVTEQTSSQMVVDNVAPKRWMIICVAQFTNCISVHFGCQSTLHITVVELQMPNTIVYLVYLCRLRSSQPLILSLPLSSSSNPIQYNWTKIYGIDESTAWVV